MRDDARRMAKVRAAEAEVTSDQGPTEADLRGEVAHG